MEGTSAPCKCVTMGTGFCALGTPGGNGGHIIEESIAIPCWL